MVPATRIGCATQIGHTSVRLKRRARPSTYSRRVFAHLISPRITSGARTGRRGFHTAGRLSRRGRHPAAEATATAGLQSQDKLGPSPVDPHRVPRVDGLAAHSGRLRAGVSAHNRLEDDLSPGKLRLGSHAETPRQVM